MPAAQLLQELMVPSERGEVPGTGVSFVDGDGLRKAGSFPNGNGGDALGGEGPRGSAAGPGGHASAARGRDMSAFEKKALEKARALQRKRLDDGEPQVKRGESADAT